VRASLRNPGGMNLRLNQALEATTTDILLADLQLGASRHHRR